MRCCRLALSSPSASEASSCRYLHFRLCGGTFQICSWPMKRGQYASAQVCLFMALMQLCVFQFLTHFFNDIFSSYFQLTKDIAAHIPTGFEDSKLLSLDVSTILANLACFPNVTGAIPLQHHHVSSWASLAFRTSNMPRVCLPRSFGCH